MEAGGAGGGDRDRGKRLRPFGESAGARGCGERRPLGAARVCDRGGVDRAVRLHGYRAGARDGGGTVGALPDSVLCSLPAVYAGFAQSVDRTGGKSRNDIVRASGGLAALAPLTASGAPAAAGRGLGQFRLAADRDGDEGHTMIGRGGVLLLLASATLGAQGGTLPPLTSWSDQTHYYVKNAFDAGSLLIPALPAAIVMLDPPSHYPHEWKNGGAAFGRNFGDALATELAAKTGKYVAAGSFREDPR